MLLLDLTFWFQPQMVLHELGHLVGLVHEHCRPDRDAHIMVNWNNIRPDMAYNFDKVQDVRILTPYDLSSFMHYGLKVSVEIKLVIQYKLYCHIYLNLQLGKPFLSKT